MQSPRIDLAAVFSRRSGSVESFDDHRGTGEIVEPDGETRWPFHCTRIADGSRSIAVGAAVTFRIHPAPTGVEAMAVAPEPRSRP